jgi:hypothetical protein
MQGSLHMRPVRMVRVINILCLIEQDLLSLPPYLGHAIIQSKTVDYRLPLKAGRRSEWQEWLPFMLTAVEEPAQ